MIINEWFELPGIELRPQEDPKEYAKQKILEKIQKIIKQHTDNRPIHTEFRWKIVEDLEPGIGNSFLTCSFSLVLAYTQPEHCLSSTDLLFYTQVERNVRHLEIAEMVRTNVANAYSLPSSFERIRFVRSPIAIGDEYFHDYWQRI